jgi:peptide-methionine (R)-S-oxide reductase
MNRRQFLRAASAALLAPGALAAACRAEETPPAPAAAPAAAAVDRLDLPKATWKQLLPPEAYRVLFEEDTERPFTSPLNDEKRAGLFVCAACYLPLFSSDAKYDSGTGWPSFFRALPGRVGTKRDRLLLVARTEYHCIRCGGHQGHVFDDGPPPTGQRWCNNGVALRFVPEGEPPPPLRTGA